MLKRLTVLIHARLQALFQPTCLALVTMSLVHWTHACTGLAPVNQQSRILKGESTQNEKITFTYFLVAYRILKAVRTY